MAAPGEAGRKGIWVEADAEAAEFEVLVVLVEGAAALGVEEEVAVFDPDVQAGIAAAAGHGFGGVFALGGPGDVVGVEPSEVVVGAQNG